jgi:hypothetical protein
VTIAYFQYGDPEREAFGIRLLRTTVARLQGVVNLPPNLPAPVGPDFSYDACPRIFRGRRGRGPLHIVWDTNLLIDYFKYGRVLWESQPLPDEVESYADELEALQLVIALWVIRDLRFHILMRVLMDAKRRLSEQRLADRINALNEFAASLRLIGSGEPESRRS